MKIKKGFILREVAGNNVVVAVGEATKHFNGIINLNDTGTFLWRLLEKGATVEELSAALIKEYGIDKALADRDAEAFAKKCTDAGLTDDE